MIDIRPMDESYIHAACLHGGPIDTGTWAPDWDIDSTELPTHPWRDQTIAQIASEHGNMILCDGAVAQELMREMIQRYGTCALLAWDAATVVGHIQFYPMNIARLVEEGHAGRRDPSPILDSRLACEPQEDAGTLWVHCVMTSAPYATADEAGKLGARKGLGLRLARALTVWAKEHSWTRIVKVAHCDLDWFYGIQGGGGRGFWEKAGFQVASSFYREAWSFDEPARALVDAQMSERGMSERDIWTWYRMRYEVESTP